MSAASQRISAAIEAANKANRTGLVPFFTAGYPDKDEFITTLKAIAS
jgi:tryptophan synthase alpha subunit